MKNKIILLLIIPILLILTGCKSSQHFVITDTTVTELNSLVRDFAGINGFQFVYANEGEEKSAYRLYLGTTSYIVPAQQETVVQGYNEGINAGFYSKDEWASVNQRQDYRTIKTTNRPAEKIDTTWMFKIQLFQQDNQVMGIIEASGGVGAKRYLKEFVKQLKHDGLEVLAIN